MVLARPTVVLKQAMWLRLDGIKQPLRFDGTDELVDVLNDVLRGWRLTRLDSSPDMGLIHLSKGPKGYQRRSPWIERGTAVVHPDPVDAVCDLLLDLHHAFIEDSAKHGGEAMLTLHAAGVRMGGGADAGLVVFPSTHASGKSLLTTALGAARHRVFADDQLPIVPGTPTLGVSPGFLPRVRRPLPDDLDDKLAEFIRGHAGPTSDQFRYVDLNADAMAPRGEKAPIKAVVLLDRRDGATPTLTPASESAILKACILQSFGRTLNALEVLDHLHAMIQGIDGYTLSYADAQDAVAVLSEAFA
ncbi:hypothetical protein [Magnetovibrio sp.]|uniref:hypothetical protein n=1 Tax=Magnetovibrio sp. TaxID=2024836 RepID=UPI002F94B41D